MNPDFIPLDAVSARPFDLNSIQIANPCRADWNLMSGDERTRHCKACAKNVYNLSALTRAEATRLVLEKEGNLCVHLHRRADGTIITSDCTVGVSSWKQPHRAFGKLIVAAVAAILGVFGVSSARAANQGQTPTRTLGAPMVMGRPTLGEPIRGEVAPVDGRVSLPSNMRLPASKTRPKSVKTNAKSRINSARRPKSESRAKPAPGHRRHR